MKSSLSTFVYFRYPLLEAIRRTGAHGFDGVEIWGGRPHAYCDDMTKVRSAEVKIAVQDAGIEISNFIPAQFRYPVNIALSDEKIRSGSVDYLKKNIDVAAEVGSPYVSICPGFTIHGMSYQEGWDSMMKSYRELLDHSKEMPVELIIEPGNRYETDLIVTVDDCLRALEDLDGKMGILVDTGHCFINRESLTDVVEKVKGLTCHFHIDDNKGVTDDHLVMGEGVIQYDIFLEKLENSGYDGFLAVELGFGYTVDPDPAVRKSIEFFKKRKKESQ